MAVVLSGAPVAAAMQDRAFASALETRALDMCERYSRQADTLYGRVLTRILARGKD